jgi:predicted O-methyltransferase YrrM
VLLNAALVRLRNLLLDRFYWPRSQQEFTRRLAEVRSPRDAVDLTFQYQGAGFYKLLKPNQDKSEITQLAERVQAIEPKVIVEIGTRDGGTLFIWSQCSPVLLVSIDLPGGIHGGGYPIQRARLYHLFTANQPRCRLELLRMDSQSEAAKRKLMALLGEQPVDFLFIDGDHRYVGVKKDYTLYADLVRPGGLIALHDIRPNTRTDTIQVHKLWNEVKQTEQHTEEIVHEPYSGRFGIGLITKGTRLSVDISKEAI